MKYAELRLAACIRPAMQSTLSFAVMIAIGCTPSVSTVDGGTDPVDGGGDPVDAAVPPIFVEATWQVRCPAAGGGCAEPPHREVFGYEGTDFEASCSIHESGESRLVELSVSDTGPDGIPFRIELTEAMIPATGGAPSYCVFSFTDGGNTYEAPCTGLPPSLARPCQVERIVFGDFKGTPTMRAEIFCVDAPATVDPTVVRGISLAGTGMGQELEPFSVVLYDCPVL